MKTRKFAWMLMVLMLGSAVVSAQGGRNARRQAFSNDFGPGTCLTALSGLTEDQKEKITQLENAHQEAMAELRTEQRSTTDPVKKNEIRGQMLKKVQAHRKEVRNLLTEEQQAQYDRLHAQNGYGGGRFRNGAAACRGQMRGAGWPARGQAFANTPAPGACLSRLSDLSAEQKDKISELNEAHIKSMADLRLKQRASIDMAEKNEIRGEMIQQVQNHRKEVRNLLTEEQQEQFDLLQAQNGCGNRGRFAARAGRGGQPGFGRRGFRGGW